MNIQCEIIPSTTFDDVLQDWRAKIQPEKFYGECLSWVIAWKWNKEVLNISCQTLATRDINFYLFIYFADT